MININIELISADRSLLGILYMKGMQKTNEKKYLFHEIGIGLLFFGIFITIYKGEY